MDAYARPSIDGSPIFLFVICCAFISVLSQPTSASHDDDEHHAKVLILGAGASGLEAAKRFHENGMDDFMIIEGADYIGGRVRNVPFGGINVEMGANWAYPEGTAIVDQVMELGIETHRSDWDNLVMRNATGDDVTDEADQSWERLGAAMEKVSEIAKDIVGNNKPDISQRAALRLGGWVPETPIDHCVEWFDFDFELAEPPEINSVRASAMIPQYADDTLMVTDQRGYSYIFNDIIEFLQQGPYQNHVRLNKTVVSVDQSSDNIVRVTCEDGTQFTGDYVLVTFSLGVMQSRSVEFIPPLPDWKVEELFQFNMAAYTRIFMKFPNKFWDKEEWIAHANERRGYYPAFLNFEADGLFPSGTNILLAEVVGEESRRVERQSSAETKAEIMQVLRDLYGDGAVPEVEEMMISDWNRNPLTRGAYSNWPVEVPQEDYGKIHARVDRLFFAGEHTDEVYFGFILGAQRSGKREADNILDCISGACPDPVYPGNAGNSNSAPQVLIFVLMTIMTLMVVFYLF